jgi:hypothetical protein
VVPIADLPADLPAEFESSTIQRLFSSTASQKTYGLCQTRENKAVSSSQSSTEHISVMGFNMIVIRVHEDQIISFDSLPRMSLGNHIFC